MAIFEHVCKRHIKDGIGWFGWKVDKELLTTAFWPFTFSVHDYVVVEEQPELLNW
jgi:hypothetical protein